MKIMCELWLIAYGFRAHLNLLDALNAAEVAPVMAGSTSSRCERTNAGLCSHRYASTL